MRQINDNNYTKVNIESYVGGKWKQEPQSLEIHSIYTHDKKLAHVLTEKAVF
jgi:hypothetical protein